MNLIKLWTEITEKVTATALGRWERRCYILNSTLASLPTYTTHTHLHNWTKKGENGRKRDVRERKREEENQSMKENISLSHFRFNEYREMKKNWISYNKNNGRIHPDTECKYREQRNWNKVLICLKTREKKWKSINETPIEWWIQEIEMIEKHNFLGFSLPFLSFHWNSISDVVLLHLTERNVFNSTTAQKIMI